MCQTLVSLFFRHSLCCFSLTKGKFERITKIKQRRMKQRQHESQQPGFLATVFSVVTLGCCCWQKKKKNKPPGKLLLIVKTRNGANDFTSTKLNWECNCSSRRSKPLCFMTLVFLLNNCSREI